MMFYAVAYHPDGHVQDENGNWYFPLSSPQCGNEDHPALTRNLQENGEEEVRVKLDLLPEGVTDIVVGYY